MKEPAFLHTLSLSGATLSGRKIYLPRTHAENRLRGRAFDISISVACELQSHGMSDTVVLDSIEKLVVAFADPSHYRGNTPDVVFTSGKAITPKSRFDYWEFLGFAVTRQGLFRAFAKSIALDKSVGYRSVAGLISLLLIDSGINFLEQRKTIDAASDIVHAAEAKEELLYETKFMIQQKGGFAKHARTERLKDIILAKWDKGTFGTNKSRAAQWASENYEINHEVVRRWLRDYERSKS
jgi:hypothetical protein